MAPRIWLTFMLLSSLQSAAVVGSEPSSDELVRRWRSWCSTVADNYVVKCEVSFAKKFRLSNQENQIRRSGQLGSLAIEHTAKDNSIHRICVVSNETYIAELAAKSQGKWSVSKIALATTPEYSKMQFDVDPFEKWFSPGALNQHLSRTDYKIETLSNKPETRVVQVLIDTQKIDSEFRQKIGNLIISKATFTFAREQSWLPAQIDVDFDVVDKARDEQTAMRLIYSEWTDCVKGRLIPGRSSVFMYKQPSGLETPTTEFHITEYKEFGPSDEPYCSLVGYGLPEISGRKKVNSQWWLAFGIAGFAFIAGGFLLRKRFAR